MSKHGSAEDKLHISPSLRRVKKLPKQQLEHQAAPEPVPPKGTNANNQFR